MTRPSVLPWTRSCFVCGEANPVGLHARSRVEGGRVVLDYTTRPGDAGYRHILHGGIGMTLLDEVMTWAAIVQVKKVCVAADLQVRLRGPVRVGCRVRVEGWVERAGSRLCLTAGELKDEQGVVRMTATGKYMPMPPDQVYLADKDFVISPESIPPGDLFLP